MNNKFSSVAFLFTLTAVILGGIAGNFIPGFMLSISFIGTLFLNSLKIIAIPFVITMIIAGLASMGTKSKVKRSLGKTALYFIPTTLTASILGVILTLIVQPGVGISKNRAHIPEEIIPHLSNFSFNNLFGSLIPESFLSASVEMQFFAIVLIAIVFGAVLTNVDRKNRIVLDFFLSVKHMLVDFMKIIMLVAPIGLFSLVGTLFAEQGDNARYLFDSAALFTFTTVFGLSFFALVILPLIVRLFSEVSPYQFFTSMIPALSTAFATNSTVATLPITEECINTTDVDQRASAFILPLGALFNSAGTALFLSSSAIFIAQLYGLTITVGQILAVVGGSFFIASMASFIPYASLFIIALVLQIANFPVHVTAGIGVLVLIDFLFGRLRTVVDVWADAVGVAVLGNTFDFKTARSAKAAIPAKRTYNKTKTRTPKESYSKTKRVSKTSTITKKTSTRKKTKETEKPVSKPVETKSPFEITADKNYLAESENNKVLTSSDKPTLKKQKTEPPKKKISKEEKPEQSANKKVTKKADSPPKKTAPKKDKPKPIIHKIEVPPLPVISSAKNDKTEKVEKVVEKPVVTKDEDSVFTKANAALSKDTIERERAKIAAQLNMMRENEALKIIPEEKVALQNKSELKEEPSKPIDDQFTKIDFYAEDETKSIVKSDDIEENPYSDEFVNTDSSVLAPEPEKTETPIISEVPETKETPEEIKSQSNENKVETAVSPNEQEFSELTAVPSDNSSNDSKSVAYGRRTSKKGLSKSSKTETSSESQNDKKEESVDKNEFAVESMSFGRGKKKK